MVKNLTLRSDECRFDIVSLGEVMLRLDPGEGRIRTARSFAAWEGGGEYNVARGLKKCFKKKAGVVTALADNDIGWLILDFIEQGGVNTEYIVWKAYDGIGQTCRNGLNFTERGFGVRGARGVSNRAYTAASQLQPGDINWDKLFGEEGVRWFHTGGIFSALSHSTAETTVEALTKAKQYGVITSYDLNYRPSLWDGQGGLERCREVNRRLVKYVDVLFGNEEDFGACLGFEVGDGTLKALDINSYADMVKRVMDTFPNLKVVANTLRTVHTASDNDWSAIAYADGKLHEGPYLNNLQILDRVGGGDSFASGLIYGLMEGKDVGEALAYGVAHGALAMTTPGDTSTARLQEVQDLVAGKAARVLR